MAKTCRSGPYLILGSPGLQECFQKRWFRCRYLGRGRPKTLRKPVLKGQPTCLGGGLGTLTSSQECRTGLSFLICKLFGACQGGSKMPRGRARFGERAARGLGAPSRAPSSRGRGERHSAQLWETRGAEGGGRGGAGAEEGGSLGGAGNRLALPPLPTRVPPSSSLPLILLPPPLSSPPADPGQRGLQDR